MKTHILIAACVLAVAGAAHAQDAAGVAPEAPAQPFSQADMDRELEAARDWLEMNLIDYGSAQFRDVQIALISPDRRNRRNVAMAVCGMVNSRNRMGGYVGYQPFYFSSGMPEQWRGELGGWTDRICGPAHRLAPTDFSNRLAPEEATR